MSTSLLYHTQCIRDYQYESNEYGNGKVIWNIRGKSFCCDKCGYPGVSISVLKERLIKGEKIGNKHFFLRVPVHRMYCSECKKTTTEQLPFLSSPKARVTKSLERTIIELRPKMSITDVSSFLDIDWKTVKDCEKKHLRKKFRHIPLKDVRIIGVDELFVRSQGKEKYITIVRDLESGAVLYVGDGKGSESLNGFLLRLKHSKAKISTVAMDMSKAYISWVEENLPNAQKVFDHFHVIKLMNDKLDKIRRRTVKELGDASMMKEALRSIYHMASNKFQAETAFKNWCSIARQTEIKELIDMAKTIENNLDGISAYWETNALSNARMEGFNNKVRWLIRQAYGFRDKDYFILNPSLFGF